MGTSIVNGNNDRITKKDCFNNSFLYGICLILKLKNFNEILVALKKIKNCNINAIQKPSEILRTPNFS